MDQYKIGRFIAEKRKQKETALRYSDRRRSRNHPRGGICSGYNKESNMCRIWISTVMCRAVLAI